MRQDDRYLDFMTSADGYIVMENVTERLRTQRSARLQRVLTKHLLRWIRGRLHEYYRPGGVLAPRGWGVDYYYDPYGVSCT